MSYQQTQILRYQLAMQRIGTSCYFIDRKTILGEGSFGKVYKGVNSISNEQVAIKDIKWAHSQKFCFERVKREIQILKQAQGKNILEYKGEVSYDQHTYIITELCQGSLQNYLADKKQKNRKRMIEIFVQIAEGIAWVHEKGYLHRDIKLSNILLGKNNQIKLCDFGLSIKKAEVSQIQTVRQGTKVYLAPQIIQFNTYSEQSDIWSMGIVMYFFLYGEYPISNKTNNIQDFYIEIANLKEKLEIQSQRCKHQEPRIVKLNQIIKKCLNINPVRRYNSIELRSALRMLSQQPILKEMNKKNIIKKNMFNEKVTKRIIFLIQKCHKINCTGVLKQNLQKINYSNGEIELDVQLIKNLIKVVIKKYSLIIKLIEKKSEIAIYENEIELIDYLLTLQSSQIDFQNEDNLQEFNVFRPKEALERIKGKL